MWAVESIEFLLQQIDAGGITRDPSGVASLRQLPSASSDKAMILVLRGLGYGNIV